MSISAEAPGASRHTYAEPTVTVSAEEPSGEIAMLTVTIPNALKLWESLGVALGITSDQADEEEDQTAEEPQFIGA